VSGLVRVALRHKSAGLKAGAVVSVSEADAAYLIENGNAVPVADKPEPAAKASEKSVKD